jgi:hypothetical protein
MPEQVGILLLFLVVVLFNLISMFLSRRKQQAEADEAARPPGPPPVPPRLPPRVVVAPPRVAAPTPGPVPAPAPVRRAAVARLPRGGLGGPRELRRAIVLLTVLGPCRALEDDPRGAGAPR